MCQSQWRLYGFITDMYNDLRKKNVGICKNTGKKFGELMQHFVLGLDEAYIMSDAGGNIRIIGAANRKKHENILADRWVGIYTYYTGVCTYHIFYMEALI